MAGRGCRHSRLRPLRDGPRLGAAAQRRPPLVRERLRALPRRRRQRRRDRPAIVARLPRATDDGWRRSSATGCPRPACPAFPICPTPDTAARRVPADAAAAPRRRAAARARRDDRRPTLAGWCSTRSSSTCSCSRDDRRIHLLRKAGERYRRVTSQADWPTYHGSYGGNRYSAARQIDQDNVARLAPALDLHASRTPAPAGHAGRGRRRHVRHQRQRVLCARRRQRPADLALPAAAHEGTGRQRRAAGSTAAWRWPAIACSWSPTTRISSRSTASPARCCGTRRWPTGARTTARRRRRWPSGNLVISGISGGDEGVRGFLAAFDQATGQGSVALLDGAEAGRAGIGDVAGQGHRASLRHHLADRHLRSRARHALLADRQSLPRLRRRRAAGRQPLLRLDPGPRPEDAAG